MPEAPSDPGLYFDPIDQNLADITGAETILPGRLGPSSPGPPPPPAPPGGSGPGDAAGHPGGLPFRPRQRPPTAMLGILFDGDNGAEWLPVRAERTVIGRTDGDIRILHDGQISGKHAEITRTFTPTGYRWQLIDVGSRNGTFVRITKVALLPGFELLIGQTRYRFDEAPSAVPTALPTPVDAGATVLPVPASIPRAAAAPAPSLVETSPLGDGPRINLTRDEYWLGTDPNFCAIVPRDDPFISFRHARFFRSPSGKWRVEHGRSLNGLWLRATQPIPVTDVCQFQLGEQRFILKVSL